MVRDVGNAERISLRKWSGGNRLLPPLECDFQVCCCPLRGTRAEPAGGAGAGQIIGVWASGHRRQRRPQGGCCRRHPDRVGEVAGPIAGYIRWLIGCRPGGGLARVERRGCQADGGSRVVRQGNTGQPGIAVVGHLPAVAHLNHHVVADIHQRRAWDALLGDGD